MEDVDVLHSCLQTLSRLESFVCPAPTVRRAELIRFTCSTTYSCNGVRECWLWCVSASAKESMHVPMTLGKTVEST